MINKFAYIIKGDINEVRSIIDYYKVGKLGLWKIGDRDISEWDTTEVYLYGIKIGKSVQRRSWDISEVGIQVRGI